jgi:hypothetical protein
MTTVIMALRMRTPLCDDVIRIITELHLLDLKHQKMKKEISGKLKDILECMNFYYIFQLTNQSDLEKRMNYIQKIVSENKQYVCKDLLQKIEELTSAYEKYVSKYEETISANYYEIINNKAYDAAEDLDKSIDVSYDLLTE